MLSRVIFVKIDTRRVFAVRVSSTRPLSSLFKHPEFQCTSLLQQPVYSQGKCYHNAEAESTGARRQQHLIEQQSKAKFQPLKSASGTNNNKRFLIPSMTTHKRHLGPLQSPLTGPKPTAAPATDSVDIIRKGLLNRRAW
ncbi:uncharacterized protein LOC129242934 isoform X2 [Anastrepha obliqua]|uniref:uncharacterized protein LOC129242934 isoform X2 n=1 Tax=Anastrepha obliqua TaxID=95512 RepID=UPI00240972C3|nr:uncharacterized protein LOC129242934 isoform X2 [Anastrepha obliqua]